MPGRTRHVSVRHSILVLLTILTANASARHGLLHPKRADTCSSSSTKCSGSGLPGNFCCSSGTTCISIDSGSSVICCPEGQDCSFIQPITCDVSKQNASTHPNNVIKTTRLDDDLPTCGSACCPFGYSCQGNFCAMNEDTSSSTTTKRTSTSTTTTSDSESSTKTTTATTETITDLSSETTDSASSTPTADETDSPLSIADDLSTVTVTDTSSLTTPTPSEFSIASDNSVCASASSCPSFPTNAVLAGFFPGAVFGAVAALLLTVCLRRRQRNNMPAGEKIASNTYRNSTGTLIGISDPIASDESSFRTDFLLTKRHSEGSRSVLSRSRSRVKSLFSTTPKFNPQPAADIPAVPPVPAVFGLPETPRPKRQPSSESIRIYTPPGIFVNPGPSPYSDPARPNTTLTEILDMAQAKMQAESARGSGAVSKTSSTATGAIGSGTGDTGAGAGAGATSNTGQRFLLPPPQKLGGGRRKQLPY
ncbi:uncharacterized protein BDV14DRAFT_176849 [Aspergillus stella-maris]|uniref:uncharacterized protein n=1 Tax=Aspergillus stella-maris TaxID=1810926 RepID=UPI003CCD8D9F